MRKTHGESRAKANGNSTQLYEAWQSIKRRCLTDSDNCSHRYKGRGITICDEWINDFCSFRDWSRDNGFEEGVGLSIDRIDNDGNYEPRNCQWILIGRNSTKDQCGEDNHQSKLKEGEVWLIRRILAAGVATQYTVARMFNVSQTCISKINCKIRWGRKEAKS